MKEVFNDNDISKAASPMEPMGGVEETCLDDSVVEETTDISRNYSEQLVRRIL